MTTTPEADDQSVLDQAQAILSRLPAKRWRALQIRFDASVKDLGDDPIAMLVIMAHEHWRATGAGPVRDDWDRFEDMSLGELNDYLGITGAASKSDAVPAQ
jgi:hypothetical protein